MRVSSLALGMASSLMVACAMNPPPVPVSADPPGQALVIGEWAGEYYTPGVAHSGSILLRFEDHDSTGFVCHGDVVLVTRAAQQPYRMDEEGFRQPEDPVRVLAIESVDVKGDVVTGVMVPYQDPETGETLSTWFEGRVSGNRITGTLVTIHGRSGVRETGTWTAERK